MFYSSVSTCCALDVFLTSILLRQSTHCALDSQKWMGLGNSHHSCPGLEQFLLVAGLPEKEQCSRMLGVNTCSTSRDAAWSCELGCSPNTTLGAQQPLGKDFALCQTAGALLWAPWLKERDSGGLGYLQDSRMTKTCSPGGVGSST